MHFDRRRHPAVSRARFLVLAFIAQTLWFGFWSTLIYLLGPAALTLAGFRMILFLILVWIAARLIYRWKFETKREP